MPFSLVYLIVPHLFHYVPLSLAFSIALHTCVAYLILSRVPCCPQLCVIYFVFFIVSRCISQYQLTIVPHFVSLRTMRAIHKVLMLKIENFAPHPLLYSRIRFSLNHPPLYKRILVTHLKITMNVKKLNKVMQYLFSCQRLSIRLRLSLSLYIYTYYRCPKLYISIENRLLLIAIHSFSNSLFKNFIAVDIF